MDDNQFADASYEDRARLLLRDLGWVLGLGAVAATGIVLVSLFVL